jgi:chromosome partitioning protein
VPTIVAANTKGGSGKSTSCLVLGTALARKGATVRVIDADPQGTLRSWSDGQSKYRDIVVTPTPGEDLTDLIDRLAAEYQFVIIDVQGTANQELAAAMSRADLVIIPMRGKTADAEVATNAINLLRKQEKLFKKRINHGVLFVATSAGVKTREEKDIRVKVEGGNIPCFQTQLHERTAYSHMFRFKLSIDELEGAETSGLPAALENADAFRREVTQILRQGREEQNPQQEEAVVAL